MFDSLITALDAALKLPLPGLDIQMEMAPPQRGRPDKAWVMSRNPRRAAVLALLYPVAGEPHLVLTQRHSYAGVHSDQISFPGGQPEAGDLDLAETALRESEEEVGIDRKAVRLLGPLTELYIPPSNFLVQPYLGYCPERPVFSPQPEEVREILEVPLSFFTDPGNITTRTLQVREQQITTPVYRLHDKTIWGATAMMLRELAALTMPYFSSLGR